MKCSEIHNNLFEYLDGELAEDDRSALEAHLGSCDSCRKEVSETRRLFLSLKEIRLPEPSPNYWDTILPRVHEAIGRKSRTSLAEILFHAVFPATATVAAFLVGMFLLPLQHEYSTEDVAAGLRHSVSGDIQLLAEQISFTVASDPFEPKDNTDISATGDREQILSIFRSNDPALTTVDDEHLRAFDGLSEPELGKLLALSE